MAKKKSEESLLEVTGTSRNHPSKEGKEFVMTREVKEKLYVLGFDFITMADSGAKDGVSL